VQLHERESLLRERQEHVRCIEEMAHERQQQARVFDSLTSRMAEEPDYGRRRR
jgi:hypothetical protein